MKAKQHAGNKITVRWSLVVYDILVLLLIHTFLLVVYGDTSMLSAVDVIVQILLSGICIFSFRLALGV